MAARGRGGAGWDDGHAGTRRRWSRRRGQTGRGRSRKRRHERWGSAGGVDSGDGSSGIGGEASVGAGAPQHAEVAARFVECRASRLRHLVLDLNTVRDAAGVVLGLGAA